MDNGYFWRVRKQTATNFWVNNVTLEQAKLGLEAGAVGCTQNPAYLSKVVGKSTDAADVDAMLKEILADEKDDAEALAKLQIRQINRIAELFLPLYEETDGKEGYVSIQADPFKENTADILRFAHMAREKYPNIICKIPVVKEALPALEQLIKERVPILATEVMSVSQAIVLNELYNRASKGVKDPAPVFIAHIAGIFDEQLQADVKDNDIDVSRDALWQAGISVAKKIKGAYDAKQSKIRFMDGGARGLHHFTEMVGVRGYVTINYKGTADKLLEEDPVVIDRFSAPVAPTVIDELLVKVPNYRKAWMPDGLKVEEFESFPPVVRFRTQFENGWKAGLEYVKNFRAENNL